MFKALPPACVDDDFDCGDGSCIPNSWLCDSYGDCPNNSDEEATLCGRGKNQFLPILKINKY